MKNKLTFIFALTCITATIFAQQGVKRSNTNNNTSTTQRNTPNTNENVGADTSNLIPTIEVKVGTLEIKISNISHKIDDLEKELNGNVKSSSPKPSQSPTPAINDSQNLKQNIENLEKNVAMLESKLNELTIKLQTLLNAPKPTPMVTPSPTPNIPKPTPNQTPVILPSSPNDENNLKTMGATINSLSDSMKDLNTELKDIKDLLKKSEENQSKMLDTLKGSLKSEIKEGAVSVDADKNNLVKIKLNNTILFGKGEVSLSEVGQSTLKKIAPYLKSLKDKDIYIIGHADKSPITGEMIKRFYPTNWELSVARSVMVVRFLTEELGVSPQNITAGGKSYYSPAGKGESSSKEAMKEDRRTEIWIFPHIKQGESINPESDSSSTETTVKVGSQTTPQTSNPTSSREAEITPSTSNSQQIKPNNNNSQIASITARPMPASTSNNTNLQKQIDNSIPRV